MPEMFVSNVSIGLRFAMETIACAARWKTVSISVLGENAFQAFSVAHIAANHSHLSNRLGTDQIGLRYPVAKQADHVRAEIYEGPRQPRAEKSRTTGHQRRAVAPEFRFARAWLCHQ